MLLILGLLFLVGAITLLHGVALVSISAAWVVGGLVAMLVSGWTLRRMS